MILFYTYKLHTFIPMQVLPGHELLAGDGGARAGARGRPHATPQPHRSSAWTWRRTFSPPPPARGPTGLGAHLPPRAGPSVILGVWPPRGYEPTAHARPSPQRTQTASNSKKEGLRKGHKQVCTGLHRFAQVWRQVPARRHAGHGATPGLGAALVLHGVRSPWRLVPAAEGLGPATQRTSRC